MIATPLLQMRGIEKSFPGVRALRGIDLTLHAGEVLALVGENGAGKSTLLKVLGGAQRPDAGEILLDGRKTDLSSPNEALRSGIVVIYQEFNLVPALSVRENMFLGREQTTGGWLRHREERHRASEILKELGLNIDPETPCRELSIACQQTVEIAKALLLNARVLVMDEPTAALAPTEVGRLLDVVENLKRRGVGIIYVSHRLDEVFRVADRVMVLRDGAHIATDSKTKFSRNQLIELMVGRKFDQEFPPRRSKAGPVRLEVKNLCRNRHVRAVSFQVRAGEILAIAGLVNSGRTETARLLFGADRRDSGEVLLDGKPLSIRGPRSAVRAGIALLTEDRKQQGLILSQSVVSNFALPNLGRFSASGLMLSGREVMAFRRQAQALRLDVNKASTAARHLSGGNQQKLVLAKWIEASCDVLIFDEPTRGIDVGAKYEIYCLMREMAAQGKCLIMISSDLPEVLGMADRILVMRGGSVAGEIADAPGAREADVLQLAVH